LEHATKALQLDKVSPDVLYRSALVYEQVDDRDRAVDFLLMALAAGESRAEVDDSTVLEDLRRDKRFIQMDAGPRPKG
jgi:hypothetical protein